jgi:hypothetical protein
MAGRFARVETRLNNDPAASACLAVDLSAAVAGTGLAHQLA